MTLPRSVRLPVLLPLVSALLVSPALAHTGHGDVSGFANGFLHPLLGADHLSAMLAVGLWSGFVLRRRVWAGAASFMGAMTLGATINWAGVALPMVEGLILMSVLVFGLLVAAARPGQTHRMTAASLAAIAAFALAHGSAHAAEATGDAAGYLAGFLVATGALHLAGIGIARKIARGRAASLAQTGLGAAIALGGLAMMAG